jgi:hypothetical protein
LVLFVGPPASWATGAKVQASVGIVLLGGAALSWVWPPATRPYLLLLGVALVGAVAWYPWFMFQAVSGAAHSGVKRFGHAPGVLAMGLAFGLRLLVDFGAGDEERRRGMARYAGITGLMVGGCLDAFVLYWVMTAFMSA